MTSTAQASDAKTSTAKTPRQSQIVLNTLMMPEHANHFGNVHGGIIMKLADEAAAIAAMRHAQKPCVTVAMDSMTFKQPVHIGEIVTCTATVTYTRRSSMEVSVEVTAEEPISGKVTLTNSAHLVFVAVDATGRFSFERVEAGLVHFVFRPTTDGDDRPVITPAFEL